MINLPFFIIHANEEHHFEVQLHTLAIDIIESSETLSPSFFYPLNFINRTINTYHKKSINSYKAIFDPEQPSNLRV